MWEEDPRYQQAAFKVTLGIGVVGTLMLVGLSCWLGDPQPLRDWLWPLALMMLGWLMVVGFVVIVRKMIQGLARKRAVKYGKRL